MPQKNEQSFNKVLGKSYFTEGKTVNQVFRLEKEKKRKKNEIMRGSDEAILDVN